MEERINNFEKKENEEATKGFCIDSFLEKSYIQNPLTNLQPEINEIEKICQLWNKNCKLKIFFYQSKINPNKARIFVFGSLFLQVVERNSNEMDVDLVCVVPFSENVSLQTFFEELFPLLQKHLSLKKIRKIQEVRVPRIELHYILKSEKAQTLFEKPEQTVSFDLLFAKIPSPSIPSSTLELDDKIFRGFKDSLSMEAINGRRDTEYILKIIEKSYVNFQYLLKFVKLWAKKKAIYSSSIGFLNGYAWSVLVAYFCKQKSNLNGDQLIIAFFNFFAKWNWDNSIYLTSSTSYVKHKKKDMICILTSSFPVKNASQLVSKSTLSILQEEFTKANGLLEGKITIDEDTLTKIMEPSDFFTHYESYLQIIISGLTDEDFSNLIGWTKSHLMILIYKLEAISSRIHARPFPHTFPHQSMNFPFSCIFLVGIQLQEESSNTLTPSFSIKSRKRIDFGAAVDEFKTIFFMWKEKPEGSDLSVKHIKGTQVSYLQKYL